MKRPAPSPGVYDDLDDEHSLSDFLERCRRDFELTKNPLFAWEAWSSLSPSVRREFKNTAGRVVRPGNVEFPRWLASYFDECSRALLSTQPDDVGRQVVGQAIGLRSGLAMARKRWGGQFDDREKLAERVFELMWKQGLTIGKAGDLLASRRGGPSAKTAISAARRANRWAIRRVQDRMRTATGTVPERHSLLAAYSRLCRSRRPKRSAK